VSSGNQALTILFFLGEFFLLDLKDKMKQIIYLLCGSAILLLIGCTGYQLGGNRPTGVDTAHVAAVVNATREPEIEIQVTEAIRQQLQFDGRLKLRNSPENADAIIDVELTDYSVQPISFRDDLKTTPDQYRIRITAVATLRNTATGEILSESKTFGEARFVFESDLTTSKRDALPIAAKELAKFMVDDLIEQW
jgi:hypothetical protein